MLCQWTTIVLFMYYEAIYCCSPFDSRGSMSAMPSMSLGVPSNKQEMGALSLEATNKALGQNTHLGSGIPLSLGPESPHQITSKDELFCFDFDDKCRWKNVDGISMDQLDWFQGVGYLEENRLLVATGTRIKPEGYYAIVATEKIHSANGRAILVSDPIKCQRGKGTLRFMYWTSPKVQIKVCTKRTVHILPEYDFCSIPIEMDDPGPASVLIEDQGMDSFQIYIIAENFVWQAVGLQGGFAVIDNIEYEGEMCGQPKEDSRFEYKTTLIGDDEPPPPLPPVPDLTVQSTKFPTLVEQSSVERESQKMKDQASYAKLRHIKIEPNVFSAPMGERAPFKSRALEASEKSEELNENEKELGGNSIVENEEEEEINTRNYEKFTEKHKSGGIPKVNGVSVEGHRPIEIPTACDVLSCNFESGSCIEYAKLSSWSVSDHPIGNPLTGIRGDGSMLPFNKDGSFAYISGPKMFSRLVTPAFDLSEDVYFVFAYHKVDRNARFRVYAKRADQHHELLLYEAPNITKDSRRWFREGKILQRALYQYVAFEVRNVTTNNYIGLDEMMILNSKRQPFCIETVRHLAKLRKT